jgi:sec-independent protein translocase protein TatC
MTYSYLSEIRYRFYSILFYFFFTLSSSFLFCDQIIYLLIKPLEKICSNLTQFSHIPFHLIFTELTEIFLVQTKLATYTTLIFLFPILLSQIYLFLKPGLYKYEKDRFAFFVFLSFFLTLLSIVFTFFVLLPIIYNFLLSHEPTKGLNIYLETKMDKYLNLSLDLFLFSYLVFLIPFFFVSYFYFLKYSNRDSNRRETIDKNEKFNANLLDIFIKTRIRQKNQRKFF